MWLQRSFSHPNVWRSRDFRRPVGSTCRLRLMSFIVHGYSTQLLVRHASLARMQSTIFRCVFVGMNVDVQTLLTSLEWISLALEVKWWCYPSLNADPYGVKNRVVVTLFIIEWTSVWLQRSFSHPNVWRSRDFRRPGGSTCTLRLMGFIVHGYSTQLLVRKVSSARMQATTVVEIS